MLYLPRENLICHLLLLPLLLPQVPWGAVDRFPQGHRLASPGKNKKIATVVGPRAGPRATAAACLTWSQDT